MELKSKVLLDLYGSPDNSLRKLYFASYPAKPGYNIKRIIDLCDRNYKKIQKKAQELIRNHSELDEKENQIIDIEAKYGVKVKDQESLDTAIKELADQTILFDRCEKIHVDILANAKGLDLAPVDWQRLAPMLEGLDQEEQNLPPPKEE